MVSFTTPLDEDFMRKKLLIIILALFAAVEHGYPQAQGVAKIDSLTLAYYRQCQQKLTHPIVVSMADTLFEMATDNGDLRMQAVALCTKLDHYFYGQHEHKEDSIVAWVDRIKVFARQTNQPKYYYFVWAIRLINYYIMQGEYNIALLETEKMLKEAEAEDYKEGISDCYFTLSNIYTAKGLNDKAQEFRLKEIELFETYQLERYSISVQYTSAAREMMTTGKLDQAVPYLEKGVEHAKSSYHRTLVQLDYVTYYVYKKNFGEASRLLTECREVYRTDKSLAPYLHLLYPIEIEFYRATGRNKDALQSVDKWLEALEKRGETVSFTKNQLVKADIYWEMGKIEKAAELYRQVLVYMEEEKSKNEEITTAEFATLLNLQKVNAEKKELEQLNQERKLQNTRIFVASLCALLFIVILFSYYQKRLNSQLKRSRNALEEKNASLIRTREDLFRAKEMAEANSRMKTEFIQNMSHEIRTPLNSIVGFSSLLAEMFSEGDDEIKQYSLTIENNSRLLLKMISDILDIADLDEENHTIELQPTHVNNCCLMVIEENKPLIAEGVTLTFAPPATEEDIIVTTNGDMIRQVLNNLVNNAAKFTTQGNITLSYHPDYEKQLLIFTVTDTGIGIPAEHQESIFERFAKIDDFTQGTGLGLSISKLIAEKLGGYLAVDGEYKEGARFVLGVKM